MRIILGGALLTVAACAAVPSEEDVPEAGVSAYRCNAEAVRELVGRPATSALGAQALRRSGSRRLRWIRPDDMVTMDYSPERLNVRLDAQHRVESFTCG